MNNKKSQSSIIVTVLLILVGLVAVSIVAIWVIGFVRENTAFDNAQVELSIVAQESFNGFYNNGDDSENAVFVKVSGGQRNVELVGIKFVFTLQDGSNVVLETNRIMGLLETKSYYSILGYGTTGAKQVEIYPIVQIKGKERTLELASKSDLGKKTIASGTANAVLIDISVDESGGISNPGVPF